MSTEAPTKSELKKMKKSELENLATSLNLKTTGSRKNVIYKQVYEHYCGADAQSGGTTLYNS